MLLLSEEGRVFCLGQFVSAVVLGEGEYTPEREGTLDAGGKYGDHVTI
jgi:hypothetical protein